MELLFMPGRQGVVVGVRGAVISKDRPLIASLLKRGADINEPDSEGMKPLTSYAVSRDDQEDFLRGTRNIRCPP